MHLNHPHSCTKRGYTHKAIPIQLLDGFDPDCPTILQKFVLVDFYGGKNGRNIVMALDDFTEYYQADETGPLWPDIYEQ